MSDLRLALLDAGASRPVEDLFRLTLDTLESLTGSSIGFFHLVDEDQDQIHLQVWSTNTVRSMCRAEPETRHYPVSHAGVWADCIRTKLPTVHNDYPALPNRKGLPEGHAPVVRELVSPVIRNGHVVGIFGVGNKPADYTAADVALVQEASTFVVELVLRRRIEQENELFFEVVPDLVCIVSAHGLFRRINEHWSRVLGYGSPDLVGRAVADFVHADDREAWRTVSARPAEEASSPATTAIRFRSADGTWRWLEWTAKPMPGQGLVFCAARDVTDQRHAEQTQQRRIAMLRVLSTIGDIIAGTESFESVLQKTVVLLPKSSYVPDLACARITFDGNAYATPNCVDPPLKISTDLVVAGQVRGVVQTGYVDDRTDQRLGALIEEERPFISVVAERLGRVAERKQAEAERDALRGRLQWAEKMETLGMLAGGVAHDYGNILAATALKLEALDRCGDLSPEARSAVDGLARLTDRASKLTRQLLTFSRRSAMRRRPVDLNQLLVDVSQMLGRLLGERVEMVLDTGTPLPPVLADGDMLEQVFTNLLINARDAMPEGGRISVRTVLDVVDEARARSGAGRHAGRFVRIDVADTGVGMPPEVRQRVFEPFFTTKTAGKGTGLGLATAFGTIRQHGGWIDVDSAPGTGSVFRVYLPADAQGAPRSPSAPPPPASGRSGA